MVVDRGRWHLPAETQGESSRHFQMGSDAPSWEMDFWAAKGLWAESLESEREGKGRESYVENVSILLTC